MAILSRNQFKFINIELNPSDPDAANSEILSGMFTGSLIITHIKPKNSPSGKHLQIVKEKKGATDKMAMWEPVAAIGTFGIEVLNFDVLDLTQKTGLFYVLAT